ncbi:MAG: hypothetical protein CSB06_00615 [Bacteroidia bacterium]|nr:MAG: hypothetical protein CSB06_00615 [Bacteroidia bacterium]
MLRYSYKLYNNLMAWVVFFVALLTYSLTVEPSVSLWDCGEFIVSSYKLEVGHPPGAPLFMLLGRFFSIFSSSPARIALMINYTSVLASAFTIFFLFLTITAFARKLILKNEQSPNKKQTVAILASGFTGALVYTFSDTFWFSAVEAEVYALSSLFTAVVFWAILKWEQVADQPYGNRWLIFIAYMMGLSIGVHLLNLLAIPAIVFVYYFKKYKVSPKGIVGASAISVLLLLGVMYGIIQGYVRLAAQVELLFVNVFGLPFKSGLLFFLFLTVLLLVGGIIYTLRRNKPLMNFICTTIAVILIGYSSFAVIMIRSAANPPMDENNPEDVFALLSYLNREQYGSRPLLYGRYYDADVKRDAQGNPETTPEYTYILGENKYEKVEKTNPNYHFQSERKTFFPRMYSAENHHVNAYKMWGGISGEKPSFINNLRFFFTYQLGHMYLRYFMWNFSGRQNNLQSYGGILKGNAISGIKPLDRLFLGNQNKMPDYKKGDKSRNAYYLLPLLLGIFGFVYQWKRDKKNFTVLLLLFFFTGIAIVMYLNQTPYQPRERDYAYAGSFYAFSIWVGLGISAIFSRMLKKINDKAVIASILLLMLPAPVIMAVENWDDHNRSGRFIARAAAKNYLDSCEKNAILFTYGDNDTFPLWYMQEVEGYRTDVKVINLNLFSAAWNIDQMRTQTYEAAPVPFLMKSSQYRKGTRDILYVMDNPQLYLNEKYKQNKIQFEKEFAALKNSLTATLQKSRYPEKKSQDFERMKEKLPEIYPIAFVGILQNLNQKDFVEKYKLNPAEVDTLYHSAERFFERLSQSSLPLSLAMNFVASEKNEDKLENRKGDRVSYFPSQNLCLSVPESEKTRSIYSKENQAKIGDNIHWKLNKSYLYKNDMGTLEIIARNHWKRPIYFATSVPQGAFQGLDAYLRLEGFAYRLVPYPSNPEKNIDGELLYKRLMTQFSWGRMNAPDVYLDNFSLRNIRVMDIRKTFLMTASALLQENKPEKAEAVLDKCVALMPSDKFVPNYSCLGIVEIYYRLKKTDKADQWAKKIAHKYQEDLAYFNSLELRFKKDVAAETQEANACLLELQQICRTFGREALLPELSIP